MIPVVDVSDPTNKKACEAVADALHTFGCLIVKDPRVDASANDRFLDMMESYFAGSDGVVDARPEQHFQVGVTPAYTERARPHCELAKRLAADCDCPPRPDAKWRFFWRVGTRPQTTAFEELNAPPVVPQGFPDWEVTMDTWGKALVACGTTVAQMCATGFGLPADAFTSLMHCGPHLLAPTGSDLASLDRGTVLAAFHYDLNFVTVHGKCRYPGLRIWSRDGEAIAPAIPEGCLLVQAGKQLEWLTGGHVLAGFHEVLATPKAVDKAATGASSPWRVSSTCFAHIASDNTLEPLGHFATDAALERFPPIKAGDQVKAELEAIALAAPAAT